MEITKWLSQNDGLYSVFWKVSSNIQLKLNYLFLMDTFEIGTRKGWNLLFPDSLAIEHGHTVGALFSCYTYYYIKN